MAKSREPVERALTTLQALVRRPPSDDPGDLVMSGQVPEDLQSDNFKSIGLSAKEGAALKEVRSFLSADLRFEYLKDTEVDRLTWRFVCVAYLRRKGDLVSDFVAEHARDPMERTCFFPIELLTINEAVELYGVTLLPAAAVERPPTFLGPNPGPEMGSVVAVGSIGTNYGKMSARARVVAERALRLLRATLRADQWLPDRQLRFRLGPVVWFDDSARAGLTSPPDEGWELELDEALVRQATSQEISKLPDPPTNDVERRVELALKWFERAQLAADPIIDLLYLFFALEAILGDKSEGLKAPALAVRRAMLGLLTSEGFTHPARTYLLYDEVRSTAVHGEAPPVIDQRGVDSFAWDVRRALNEFLEFAGKQGFTKRSQVRKALDQHERRKTVVAGLLRDNPELWSRYLDAPQETSWLARVIARMPRWRSGT